MSPMTPWFLAVCLGRRWEEHNFSSSFLIPTNIPQHHKIQSPHFRDADIEAEREQISCRQTS